LLCAAKWGTSSNDPLRATPGHARPASRIDAPPVEESAPQLDQESGVGAEKGEARMSQPTIDEMAAELIANGWTRIAIGRWMSPGGAYYLGPYQAWRALNCGLLREGLFGDSRDILGSLGASVRNTQTPRCDGDMALPIHSNPTTEER
jgi:hypothetical protein